MEEDRSTTAAAIVATSLKELEAYLLLERYQGYDPYDALTSPVFRLPVFRSSKWIRVAAEQALKKSPYNVRRLLGIKKGYNPVTLAFVLEASAYLAHVDREHSDTYRARAVELVEELARVRSRGTGACWGYDFPWESRYGSLAPWAPTIVATGLVSNALFVSYRLLGLEKAFALCEAAAQFVLEDVPRLPAGDGAFCWAYFPGDRQRVLNATMKGARLCAQVYSVTGDESYLQPATQTATYVARQQREDGSWPYAVADRRKWADNFHTAYVLDAYDAYARCSGDDRFRETVDKGWQYYRENLFVDDTVPKYYANKVFPVDATACAQSILTFCRFGEIAAATRISVWTIQNMQCSDGHFAYQLRRRRTVRIPYMRWSSAYMYAGLSRVQLALAEGVDDV